MGRIAGVLLLVAASFAVGAPSADAVSLTYPSATCPAGLTGLTDCIDNVASNGDTIKVKKGLYYENVVVNKDVTVAAKKCDTQNKVTFDAAPPAPPAAGTKGVGFEVASDGVTLSCLTIRHATEAVSIGTGSGFDNVTASKLSMTDVSDGVRADSGSDNLLVSRLAVSRSDGNAVDFDGGTGLRVENGRFSGLGDDSIEVDNAPGALIKGNRAANFDDGGLVEVSSGSDAAEIRDNTVTNAESEHIAVFNGSEGVVVDGNVLNGGGDNAIDVSSDQGFTVTNNRTSGWFDDDVFDLNCLVPCEDGTLIENNRSSAASLDDDEAWEVDLNTNPAFCATPPCNIFRNNTSGRGSQDSMRVNGRFVLFSGNVSEDSTESDSNQGNGFVLNLSTSTVVENVARTAATDGFVINGDENVIERNRAEANAIDGFHLTNGTGNTFNENTAIGNEGDGIENDADGTIITNNVSKKNRADCVGDTAPAVNTGNTCADGSNFTTDGTIDG